MNTLTSDMAILPYPPPLGTHWFHEFGLIGDFDLAICITSFRCPNLLESAPALVHTECDIFKCMNWFLNKDMHVRLRAVSPS